MGRLGAVCPPSAFAVTVEATVGSICVCVFVGEGRQVFRSQEALLGPPQPGDLGSGRFGPGLVQVHRHAHMWLQRQLFEHRAHGGVGAGGDGWGGRWGGG